MTKPRRPGSVEDALTMICSAIGFDVAGEIVQRSAAHVRRWTNPDDALMPTLIQAMRLEAECVRVTGHKYLTDIWVRAMSAVAAQDGPKKTPEPLPLSLMDVVAQVGLLNQTARAALGDKKLSKNERDALLRIVAQTRTEMDELEQAIYAAHAP